MTVRPDGMGKIQEVDLRRDSETMTTPTQAVGSTRTPARGIRAAAGQSQNPELPHTCRCGARWSGSRTAHCGTCDRTFSGVSGFDDHRRGGQCLDPATLGMALLAGRAFPCWGYPEATP